MNALRHGERSADALAERRESAALMRWLRSEGRREAGEGEPASAGFVGIFVG